MANVNSVRTADCHPDDITIRLRICDMIRQLSSESQHTFRSPPLSRYSVLKKLFTHADPETCTYSASTIPAQATWTHLPGTPSTHRTLALTSRLNIIVVGILCDITPPSQHGTTELTIEVIRTVDCQAIASMLCSPLQETHTLTAIAIEPFDDVFDACTPTQFPHTSLRKYRRELLKTSDIVAFHFTIEQAFSTPLRKCVNQYIYRMYICNTTPSTHAAIKPVTVVAGAAGTGPTLICMVYVSPRARAHHTFHLTFDHLPQPPKHTITEEVREWDYGEYEGMLSSEIHEKNPGWNIWIDGCPGGESTADMCHRVDTVIEKVREHHRLWHEAGIGCVVIIAHGHFNRCMIARWINFPLHLGTHFNVEPAGVAVLTYNHRNLAEPALSALNLYAPPQ